MALYHWLDRYRSMDYTPHIPCWHNRIGIGKGNMFAYNRFEKPQHSWTEGALLRYEGEGRGTSRSTVWERVLVIKNAISGCPRHKKYHHRGIKLDFIRYKLYPERFSRITVFPNFDANHA